MQAAVAPAWTFPFFSPHNLSTPTTIHAVAVLLCSCSGDWLPFASRHHRDIVLETSRAMIWQATARSCDDNGWQCIHLSPDSSSLRPNIRECLSTSVSISRNFIFSRSRFNSFPSSVLDQYLLHLSMPFNSLNLSAKKAGLSLSAIPYILMSSAMIERALDGSLARKLRAILPDRLLNGENAVDTDVMYFVSMVILKWQKLVHAAVLMVNKCFELRPKICPRLSRASPLQLISNWYNIINNTHYATYMSQVSHAIHSLTQFDGEMRI